MGIFNKRKSQTNKREKMSSKDFWEYKSKAAIERVVKEVKYHKQSPARDWVIRNAKMGNYLDFESRFAYPSKQLADDFVADGLKDLQLRALRGDYSM